MRSKKTTTMTKTTSSFLLLLVCFLAARAHGFSTRNQQLQKSLIISCPRMTQDGDNDGGDASFNPLREFSDMFRNMDDVIDDFFNKRMGNGEIFYGKRKYKPSGEVEGEYNGFGLTDKLRIDMTRERKEEWLEEKRRREEEARES